MTVWTIAALVALAAGLAGWAAGRFHVAPAVAWGPMSRALIMTAFAIYLSGFAARTHAGYGVWFSGFFVCAAIHRWIDAAHSGTPFRITTDKNTGADQ